jgi:Arc/MetJ family transcription regulator
MRTTLNIDDALLDQVMQYTEATNRSEAVRRALKAYIRQQEIHEILAMRGTMEFHDDLEDFRSLDTLPL